MSYIKEEIEKNMPLFLPVRLEAVATVLEELITLLSPEQRDKLDSAIISKYPSVKNASASEPYTISYQLSLFLKEPISSDN
ncbi:hypothetical protein [Enterobacter cloacae complex sp. ESBL7]|uniref:hypothetical protein n=1 Tax=Enterobacter cloacae complex sp. ESBL7 TaxID=3163325 RepID=UPI003566A5BF